MAGSTSAYSVLPMFFLVSCAFYLFVETRGDRQTFEGYSSEEDYSTYQLRALLNCTAPKPLEPDAILKWRKGRDNNVFLSGEKAEFVCKEGFRQIGWLKTLICRNGTWDNSSAYFENDSKRSQSEGYCLPSFCNKSKTFNCAHGNTTIDICHKCDCIADCPDGSDEMSCGAMLINVTGKASEVIKYPVPSPDKSFNYTGPMNCSRTLWTDEPGFYIKLLFKEFSMSLDCERDYVFLENATFTDPNRSPVCCKKSNEISCGFGGKSSPPLSRTVRNWMTVTLVTAMSNSSTFSATWYHVNGFFPNGFVPKEDPRYSDKIKVNKARSATSETDSEDDAYVAAVVIFSLGLFVILLIAACKVCKHFCGAKCSVSHCAAWFAAKRAQRARRSSLQSPVQQETPNENRPLRGNVQDRPHQGGPHRRAPANMDPSIRTRYGSDGNDSGPEIMA